ncbi:MAG TPA: TM0106 family RecB-like putative nuclease, partial [Actinotalea sp.]|nr:TM0106 family RecB-like putative nuclease [Actinotalea sp.]
VLLVAGLRQTQRTRLAAAGILTIDQLAASRDAVPGLAAGTLDPLRRQARLQVDQEALRAHGPDPEAVTFEIIDPSAIERLPAPDPGDLFFDFEGDPMWLDGTTPDRADAWGLEYLFGVLEAPVGDAAPVFRAFWAHDRVEEKQALVGFLAYVTERREQHPGLHVYHYAPYERTALLRLAGRHGVGERAVDRLLQEGVLVDLYATVRAGLRVGQESYSLKKLEPLYLTGDEERSGDVTNAAASVVAYAEACAARDSGDDEGWRRQIAAIAAYNRDDVVSTLRLRDWLRARAAEARAAERSGPAGGGSAARPGAADAGSGSSADDAPGDEDPERGADDLEQDRLVATLMAFVDDPAARPPDDPASRTPDQRAVALLAASLGYFWRERKPYWWAHFDRLVSDPAEWLDQRNTFHVEESALVTDWHRPPRARVSRRTLELIGTLAPGSDLRAGSTACVAVYDPPVPEGAATSVDAPRGWTATGDVLEVGPAPDGERTRLLLADRLRTGMPEHDAVPIALTPGGPPATTSIQAALEQLAGRVAEALPELPAHPALDLLRRLEPRRAAPIGPPVGAPPVGAAPSVGAVP